MFEYVLDDEGFWTIEIADIYGNTLYQSKSRKTKEEFDDEIERWKLTMVEWANDKYKVLG